MNASDDPIASAIDALEAQRTVLGDVATERAIASLRTAPADDAARRTNVTVLFADLADATASGEIADDEHALDLTNDALRRWTEAIESQRGRVVDYAGDGLLAVFGGDAAREDDAERAVLAGLAIAAATDASRPARVGIHSGPVLLARTDASRAGIHGVTVNVAARMKQSAPNGRVRISQDCFRRVRGAFELEPQLPLSLKGVGDAVTTWLVVRAVARPFDGSERGIDGVATPLVGRERELGVLRDAFVRCRDAGRLARVLVRGEAGMGKTRLLADFDRTLGDGVLRLFGRTRPHDRDVPYALVRDIVRNHLGLDEAASPRVAWARLLAATQPLFEDDAVDRTRWIAQMVGIDPPSGMETPSLDARQLRAQAFHATTTWIRRLHVRESRPLALFLEDLHWADDGSLRFIDHFVAACDDLPILIVGLARPDGDANAATDPDTVLLDLPPLSPTDRRVLADALLARIDRPPAYLRALLVDGSDGIPFFAEELLARLIDERVVVREGDRWTVDDEAPRSLPTPSTLAGLIQARIDGLSPPQRRVLQVASVVGHEFWDAIVATVEPDAGPILDELIRRDLVLPRTTPPFAGARAYVFRHHLLHQVAYDGVLRATRRDVHRRAAEWLVASPGREHFLGQIAEHYVGANDTPNAITYLEAAGDASARASAHESAARLYARALERARPDDHAQRFDLHQRRRNVMRGLRRPEALAHDVAAMEALAERLEDDARRLIAANARAALEFVLGHYPSTRDAAARASALADAADAPWQAITARLNWARALLAEGDLEAAREQVDRAGADAARGPQYEGKAEDRSGIENLLGILAVHANRLSLAAAHFERSRGAAREVGSLSMEGHALANLADLRRRVGRFDEAERLLDDARVALDRAGRRTADAHLHATAAQIARDRGRTALALERLDASTGAMGSTPDPDLEATLACIRGHALVDDGRLDEARAAYGHALAIFETLGRTTIVEPLAGLAAVHLAAGDGATALATLAPVLDRCARGDAIDAVDDLFRIYVDVDRVLRGADDPRAAAWLADGCRLLDELVAGLDAADRTSLLANLASARELRQRGASGPR